MGYRQPTPQPQAPLATGQQIMEGAADPSRARVQAYVDMMNANRKPAPTAKSPGSFAPLNPMPGPGGGGGGGGEAGPAPVVEPKPTAAPPSMGGLDAAMGGGGSPDSGQYLGSLPNGLRMLGMRKYPQDSMALAGVSGSIY